MARTRGHYRHAEAPEATALLTARSSLSGRKGHQWQCGHRTKNSRLASRSRLSDNTGCIVGTEVRGFPHLVPIRPLNEDLTIPWCHYRYSELTSMCTRSPPRSLLSPRAPAPYLELGRTTGLYIALSRYDLSTWNITLQHCDRPQDAARVDVGASSRERRLFGHSCM